MTKPIVLIVAATVMLGSNIAAPHGDRGGKALYDLGLTYARSANGRRDCPLALSAFRKAADLGNADAMNYIGILYSNGCGVPHDEVQASAWYRKAADRGQNYAMFMTGIAYWAGRGVPQDYVEAYKWLDLAASHSTGQTRVSHAAARDAVGRAPKMSPELIEQAKARARTWKVIVDQR